MRQCQLHEVKGEAVSVNQLEFAGSRADKKAARMWSGCDCVKDVLPHPYRK